MLLPTLPVGSSSQDVTQVFSGYNHNLEIADGEFYDTRNLTSAYYPVLAQRQKRGTVSTLTNPGGLIEKDALAYVANGSLWYNGQEVLTGLSTPTETYDGKKQLVSMGAYILVFPDAKYVNTADLTDKGSMGTTWDPTDAVSVTYQMCNSEGTVYAAATKSDTAPTNPANNALWIDTANNLLYQYSTTQGTWVNITSVYTKVTFSTQGQIPSQFNEYDGVQISGLHDSTGALSDDLNGSKIIYAVGGEANTTNDYIVIVGILDNQYSETNTTVSISRNVPDMDYVCECQNRIWGCRYGNDGTQNINELYCCALGDFKNWEQYLGLSTDSWRASVGSDGKWTGAVNFLGYPTFWKENRLHTITVSSTGAHQVDDLVVPGVQDGSGGSLCVVETTLYYKSRNGVFAYQGGFPGSISSAFGDEKYSDACACAFGNRYYISMKDKSNAWHLFTYDVAKGYWLQEDDLQIKAAAKVDDSLYVISGDNKIIDLNGINGTKEGDIEWSAETGTLYYSYPDKKYVSRFDMRMSMAEGSRLRMYVEYDSSGRWEKQGSDIVSVSLYTRTIPVRPRRCDHMRIKLEGSGTIRLYSVARVLETGSDY